MITFKYTRINNRAVAKNGYTRSPCGHNRVPYIQLVPGRHLIGQRPPGPGCGCNSAGCTRFWLFNPLKHIIQPGCTRLWPDYSTNSPHTHTHTQTHTRLRRDRGGAFFSDLCPGGTRTRSARGAFLSEFAAQTTFDPKSIQVENRGSA